MTIGFRIARRRRKVDAALVERFRSIPVANVSGSMSRMAAAGPRLRREELEHLGPHQALAEHHPAGRIRPVASTTHTLLRSSETSIPAWCSMVVPR